MQTKPVTGKAKLLLAVTTLVRGKEKMTIYAVRFLDPHPDVAKKPAIRLTKEDGTTSYEIHQDQFGWHCTCPDFEFRRNRKDPKGCRHICALRATGLLKDRS